MVFLVFSLFNQQNLESSRMAALIFFNCKQLLNHSEFRITAFSSLIVTISSFSGFIFFYFSYIEPYF